MKKYAKIIDEKTKQCEVGLGTNSEFYTSIGMTEQDVEQGYDGSWYIVGNAPVKPDEIKAEEVRTERDKLLNNIVWRAERYERQEKIKVKTSDTEATYLNILNYMEYLRKIPEDKKFPNVTLKTFDEWEQK